MGKSMLHLIQISSINRKLKEKNITMNPTLSEEEIQIFERKHGITLPIEYRLFLQLVGNGGGGPYYGLLPLHDEIEFISKEIIEGEEEEVELFEGKFLKLSHEGCGYFYGLALTGEETGNIWNDSRASNVGMHKLYFGFGHYVIPYGFLTWYDHWLYAGAKSMEEMIEEL